MHVRCNSDGCGTSIGEVDLMVQRISVIGPAGAKADGVSRNDELFYLVVVAIFFDGKRYEEC